MNPNSPAFQALNSFRRLKEEKHSTYSRFYWQASGDYMHLPPAMDKRVYYDLAVLDPTGTLLAWVQDYRIIVHRIQPENAYVLSDARFGSSAIIYHLKLYTHCLIVLLQEGIPGDYILYRIGLPQGDVQADEKAIRIEEMVAIQDNVLYYCPHFYPEEIALKSYAEIKRIKIPSLEKLPPVPENEAEAIAREMLPLHEFYHKQYEQERALYPAL